MIRFSFTCFTVYQEPITHGSRMQHPSSTSKVVICHSFWLLPISVNSQELADIQEPRWRASWNQPISPPTKRSLSIHHSKIKWWSVLKSTHSSSLLKTPLSHYQKRQNHMSNLELTCTMTMDLKFLLQLSSTWAPNLEDFDPKLKTLWSNFV